MRATILSCCIRARKKWTPKIWPFECTTRDANRAAALRNAHGCDASINAVDDAGRTMLHAAVSQASDPEDIRLLLDRGADATIRDKGDKRPIDLVSRSQKEIHSILKIVGKREGEGMDGI